jgi:hypothetical protein
VLRALAAARNPARCGDRAGRGYRSALASPCWSRGCARSSRLPPRRPRDAYALVPGLARPAGPLVRARGAAVGGPSRRRREGAQSDGGPARIQGVSRISTSSCRARRERCVLRGALDPTRADVLVLAGDIPVGEDLPPPSGGSAGASPVSRSRYVHGNQAPCGCNPAVRERRTREAERRHQNSTLARAPCGHARRPSALSARRSGSRPDATGCTLVAGTGATFTEIRGVEPGVDAGERQHAWWLRAPVRAGDVGGDTTLCRPAGDHARVPGAPRNPFFVHGLDALILAARPALWCFGHKHSPFAALVGETLLVAKLRVPRLRAETSAFAARFVRRAVTAGEGGERRARRPALPSRAWPTSRRSPCPDRTPSSTSSCSPNTRTRSGTFTAGCAAARGRDGGDQRDAPRAATVRHGGGRLGHLVSPVHVGQLLCCHAEVTAVGITSLEGRGPRHRGGSHDRCGDPHQRCPPGLRRAGEDGRPTPVPPVRCETGAEQERARAPRRRRRRRAWRGARGGLERPRFRPRGMITRKRSARGAGTPGVPFPYALWPCGGLPSRRRGY